MISRLSIEGRLMLVVGLLVGIAAVFFEPPAVTFDGPSHYFRVLQISRGQIRSDRFSELAMGGDLPKGHIEFINTLWNSYWGAGNFGTISSWRALAAKCQTETTLQRVQFTNTAFYSPVNYLFQVVGMVAARFVTNSPLTMHQAACFMNVVAYVAVLVVAIELMPRFRRGLLLLVTTPFILFQAASMNGDAINVSLPMLVLALAWRLRVVQVARPRLGLALVLAIGLIVDLLKPASFATLFCLLLVPTRCFGSIRTRVVVMGLYGCCVAALWIAWNRPYLDLDVARWFVPSMPPASIQKVRFLEDPMSFLGPFAHLVRYDLGDQWLFLYCYVGGWIPWNLFLNLRWFSNIGLAGIALSCNWREDLDRPWAFGMFLQAFVSLFVIAYAMWLGFASLDPTKIIYLNGRYLFTFFGCLGISFAELFHRGFTRVRSALFWAALVANIGASIAILLSIGLRVWG
jgi:uncharacterized membrane protein